MTRHCDVASSKDIQSSLPALSKLAGGIGDHMVRSCGTIGGSLANNDPAACYPSAVLALGATVVTNERSITADDFLSINLIRFSNLIQCFTHGDTMLNTITNQRSSNKVWPKR